MYAMKGNSLPEDTMAEVKDIIEDENKIDTVISDDIELKGRLVFKHSLKIKGNFEGKIESDGHLIVGQEAAVSADIKSGIVSVYGKINGKIRADRRIELYKKSITRADLVTPDISIESGSHFDGTCIMTSREK